jgi:heme oxygenase
VARVDALTALRVSTRPLHDAVEAEAGFDVAHADRASYVAHLATLERWLAEIPAFAEFEGRNAERLARLRADLALFGDGASRPTSLSNVCAEPDVDRATRYGIAYVVEGAQLGRASVRAAIERLGIAHACSYLEHREPNVWPRFLKQLDEAVTTPADVDVACHAAQQAFERFRAIALEIRRGI